MHLGGMTDYMFWQAGLVSELQEGTHFYFTPYLPMAEARDYESQLNEDWIKRVI